MNQKVREILEAIRKDLRLKDIGFKPNKKAIYLIGNPKKLNSLVKYEWYWKRLIDRTHRNQEGKYYRVYTFGDIEYPIIALLEKYHKDYKYWDGWNIIALPTPGHPEGVWWSVKNNKRMKSPKVPRYYLCDEEKIAKGSYQGPALLTLDNSKLPPIFISHGIGLHDFKQVEKCGSLLWPSLALTWKVPPMYGDIVMLMDVRTLTDYTKPLGRPSNNVLITETDSWSPTGGELNRLEQAINLELKGDPKWWRGGYEYDEGGRGDRTLQPNVIYGNTDPNQLIGNWAPDAAQNIVKTMNQFWRRVKHLTRVYSQFGDIYEYPPEQELRDELSRDDFYPYLEMKIRGPVSFNNFVACFYPRKNIKKVNSFLDKMGFEGWRVPVKWQPKKVDPDLDRANWARVMTAAILEWSDNPCGNLVPESMLQEGFSSQTYSAIAHWSRKYDPEYGGKFGWRQGYCRPD